MRHLVENYLEKRFTELEARDFEPLARAPDSGVASHLRAYRALSPEDRARFRRLNAELRASHWVSDVRRLTESELDFMIYVHNLGGGPTLPDISRPQAKARDLRKVAGPCLFKLLGGKPRKVDGSPGDWICEGTLKGVQRSVELRYACRMTQLEYGVHAHGMRDGWRISAEMLYGLGVASWDEICLSDVDAAFSLLTELIGMVVDDHSAIMRILRDSLASAGST